MSNEMEAVALAMVAAGKGILAADESFPTIKKRFSTIKIPSTEVNRQTYREMLFTTPGMSDYISGVILFDETIRQSARNGVPFTEILTNQGILPGIKVDMGAQPLSGFPLEKTTHGLDTLRDRLAEYYRLGAKFAKWRSVITIGDGIPSRFCLKANAHGLARYASLCQEAGIVPIVEPEVLMDGPHSIERCQQVSRETLELVFSELAAHRVVFEQMILKPNMVVSGKENPRQASVEEVADRTIATLKRSVPAAVPGIIFLSGGQSEQLATQHLNVMNQMGSLPWKLSFSYGRALQESALKTWAGQASNFSAGQQAFHHRARCNSFACLGTYNASMENDLPS